MKSKTIIENFAPDGDGVIQKTSRKVIDKDIPPDLYVVRFVDDNGRPLTDDELKAEAEKIRQTIVSNPDNAELPEWLNGAFN